MTDDIQLRRRLNDVPAKLIEAHPRVVATLREVREFERLHAEEAKAQAPRRKRKDRALADKAEAEANLATLKQERIAIAGGILLGEATTADERKVLDAIADRELTIERIALGMPRLDAVIAEGSQRVSAAARRIEDASEGLEAVRQKAREELAAKAAA